MGKSYHMELYEYIQKMVSEKTISPDDIQLFLFTDSVDEAIDHIRKHAIEGFGLKIRWWLGGQGPLVPGK